MDNELRKKYLYNKHYGEYSLDYWINLILAKKIELPSFQRDYEWRIEEVISLIECMNDGQFVPPVTIGEYIDKTDGHTKNLIIDGQQRLTSIILFDIGIYPVEDKVDTNDDSSEHNEIKYDMSFIINKLQCEYENYRDKEELKDKICSTGNFRKIEDIIANDQILLEKYKSLKKDSGILTNSFLGFTYLKVTKAISDYTEQQIYYSKVFRNINNNSHLLTDIDRRKAMYWISGASELFDPTFLKQYRKSNEKVDFARFLAFASETYNMFVKNNSRNPTRNELNKVGVGLREMKIDNYIVSFIDHYVEKTNIKFYVIIDKKRIKNVEDSIYKLNFPKKYDNYVQLDIYYFGLLFWNLFAKEELCDNIDCKEFNERINEVIKNNTSGNDNSSYNRIGLIRDRIYASIGFYKDYIKKNTLF